MLYTTWYGLLDGFNFLNCQHETSFCSVNCFLSAEFCEFVLLQWAFLNCLVIPVWELPSAT